MAKTAAIRFAVGSPSAPRSAMWRLWAVRSDVYLAARMSAGLVKVSLHESGIWRAAFTRESGLIFENNDRLLTRCERPAPWKPGWTQGPTIMAAGSPSTDRLSAVRLDYPADAFWLEPAPPGQARSFTVLFADADQPTGEAGGPESLIIGPLPLANGENVFIGTRTENIPPQDLPLIEPWWRETRVEVDSVEEYMSMGGASGVVLGARNDTGMPFFYDLLLDRSNLVERR